MLSAIYFNLDQSKILSSGTGLNLKLQICVGQDQTTPNLESDHEVKFCHTSHVLVEGGLILYQTKTFCLDQIESICRRQI